MPEDYIDYHEFKVGEIDLTPTYSFLLTQKDSGNLKDFYMRVDSDGVRITLKYVNKSQKKFFDDRLSG